MTVTLEGAKTVAWIHPNAGPSGYYRWTVSSDMMNRLASNAAGAMTPVERVGFLGNLSALRAGGPLFRGKYGPLLPPLAAHPSPEGILALMDKPEGVRRGLVTQGPADPCAGHV